MFQILVPREALSCNTRDFQLPRSLAREVWEESHRSDAGFLGVRRNLTYQSRALGKLWRLNR